ncbi:MAG: sugar phosphate isomerase/epimerase family protein [Opitutales bacterium]
MKLSQVALQLYTLREFLKTPEDIRSTLQRVVEIGYPAVQVSGTGPIPEEDLVAICHDLGLTICATHEPSQFIRETPEAAVERLQKLGCALSAYPFPAEVDMGDLASVDAMIADLDRAAAVFEQAGMRLTYHNHAIEFCRAEGQTILERIYARSRIQGEPDVHWIQRGGGDSVAWCHKLKGRLPIIHLKDFRMTPKNEPEFAEIGHGNMDMPAICRAAEEAGCEWFAVEQDVCPGDPFESVKMSFDYIKANLATA